MKRACFMSRKVKILVACCYLLLRLYVTGILGIWLPALIFSINWSFEWERLTWMCFMRSFWINPGVFWLWMQKRAFWGNLGCVLNFRNLWKVPVGHFSTLTFPAQSSWRVIRSICFKFYSTQIVFDIFDRISELN